MENTKKRVLEYCRENGEGQQQRETFFFTRYEAQFKKLWRLSGAVNHSAFTNS